MLGCEREECRNIKLQALERSKVRRGSFQTKGLQFLPSRPFNPDNTSKPGTSSTRLSHASEIPSFPAQEQSITYGLRPKRHIARFLNLQLVPKTQTISVHGEMQMEAVVVVIWAETGNKPVRYGYEALFLSFPTSLH